MSAAPRRPALLVIDLSLGFTDPTSPLACDADAAVDATGELLSAAREVGAPVAFTTVAYEPDDFATAEVFMQKVPALRVLRAGHRWTEIDPKVAPNPGEPILRKLFASAFFGTELRAWLAAGEIDGLVVTGASTSGCVRATVVDAVQNGLPAFVAREAVADRDRRAHDQAMADIDAKYGSVISLEEALCLFAKTREQEQ
jgi:maleamate amidohydrolase